MKLLSLSFILTLMLGLGACSKSDDSEEPIPTPTPEPEATRPITIAQYNQVTEGLKDYFPSDEYFYMGAALEASSIDNATDLALLKRHFNSLTAENSMKWSLIQPTEGNFNWTDADKIVEFAQANGMQVRGHTFAWHSQVPEWVFKDGTALASKEKVLERLRTHITAVMTRYKGKIYAWDVLNEAISDGSDVYRPESKWQTICGEDYIFEAFKTARSIDPDAKLFYNDYSATNPTKRDKIYGLLKKLKDENLVDGMGLQSHWNVDYPSNDLITAAFDKYTSLGIKLQITELDVSVYTSDKQTQVAYTADVEKKLTAAYARYFELFKRYKSSITGITFWGIADNHTWLDNFPVKGRKNYPFLFDQNGVPKQCYFKVIE